MSKVKLLNVLILICLVFHAPARGRQHPAQITAAAEDARGEKPAAGDAERRREAFELVWGTVRDYHYDPTFGGVNWEAVREEFAPRVARAQTDRELHALLQDMLNHLGKSHFNIVPPESIPILPPEEPDTSSDAEPEEKEDPPLPSREGLDVTERMMHGIGIDLRIINNSVIITRVEPASPAARAGLRPGFVVRRVDGYSMNRILRLMELAAIYQPDARHQLPSEILIGFFNGPPGTDVRINYLDARNRLRRVSVRRERLKGEMSPPLPSLPAQFVEFESGRLRRSVGYIRFNVFAAPVMEKFCAALRSMSDAPGVVIDLRGNRGGLLGLMYGIGGLLETRPVSLGVMRTREGAMEFRIIPQSRPYLGQVVILIDKTSLSASEIFANGLQESGRAVIVGEQSAGSALPSAAKELPTGAILQYVIADFRSPSGRVIEGQGVRPNIPVRLDRRSLLGGRDPQLEAAIDVMQAPVAGQALYPDPPPDPVLVRRMNGGGGKSGEESGEKTDEKTGEVAGAAIDPLVEQIIDRYVRAIGGRQAVERLSSRAAKGTFSGSSSGRGVSGKVEIFEKAPNKAVSIISIPNWGVLRRGFTGAYGYEQIPLFGFRKFGEAEAAHIRLSSDFYWSINLRQLYPKMILKGREKVGDSEAHVVEATPAGGIPATLYFDTGTGLLIRKDDAHLEDYREVDGVKVPFTIRTGRAVITLDEVKHNLEVDDARFAEHKDCFTQ